MALALGNWSALASMPGMDDAEFARWAALLEKRTGVVVPPARKAFLVTSVRGRMRETGHATFEDYYRELQQGASGAAARHCAFDPIRKAQEARARWRGCARCRVTRP